MNGTLWTIVTIGGPILLGLALLYAILSNRFRRNKAPREVTERAAKELHEELNEEDKARDA
ncbi:MAG: hypothetical protein BGP16_04785 [Sphingobium sp. 66-54]|nr:MAG: hypothetical protein BGP16_04785 [Sphingobium sp. 66-54]